MMLVSGCYGNWNKFKCVYPVFQTNNVIVCKITFLINPIQFAILSIHVSLLQGCCETLFS